MNEHAIYDVLIARCNVDGHWFEDQLLNIILVYLFDMTAIKKDMLGLNHFSMLPYSVY